MESLNLINFFLLRKIKEQRPNLHIQYMTRIQFLQLTKKSCLYQVTSLLASQNRGSHTDTSENYVRRQNSRSRSFSKPQPISISTLLLQLPLSFPIVHSIASPTPMDGSGQYQAATNRPRRSVQSKLSFCVSSQGCGPRTVATPQPDAVADDGGSNSEGRQKKGKRKRNEKLKSQDGVPEEVTLSIAWCDFLANGFMGSQGRLLYNEYQLTQVKVDPKLFHC